MSCSKGITEQPAKLKPNHILFGRSVLEVVRSNLCMGCGACVGVCPVPNAIEMKMSPRGIPVPEIHSQCTKCGLCYTVCPGDYIDFEALRRKVGHKCSSDTPFVGHVQGIYTGYAADQSLRFRASSGGFATALLCYALDAGLIDAAIVARFKPGDPTRAEPYVATTREEILSASGSKYGPVPQATAIAYIMKNEGRYAIVGLPCHLVALRSAALHMPRLRERIVYYLGLFCSTIISDHAIDFWLKVHGIERRAVTGFSYRGHGWPGKMTICTSSATYVYDSAFCWGFVNRFSPKRCTLCVDPLAELADIALGDAWLPDFRDEKQGISIAIVRTPSGMQLWNKAIAAGAIIACPASFEALINSQRGSLDVKRGQFNERCRLLQLVGQKTPSYRGVHLPSEKPRLMRALIFYMRNWIYSRRILWPVVFAWRTSVSPRCRRLYRLFRRGFKLLKWLPIRLKRLVCWAGRLPSRVRQLLLLESPWKGVEGTRVLIVNQADLLNKGDQAILSGTCQLVQKAFPDAAIRIITHTPAVDAPRAPYPILPTYRILSLPLEERILAELVLRCSSLLYHGLYHNAVTRRIWNWLSRLLPPTLRAYAECDLVISRGGDCWTEDYGKPWLYLDAVLVGLAFGKPTILLGETVGPFNDPLVKCRVLEILRRLHTVVVRDPESYEYLLDIGLNHPRLVVLPDAAFALSPASVEAVSAMLDKENLALEKPLIAFSVSALISRYGLFACTYQMRNREYSRAMATVADYCIEKYGANIVFIPHVLGKGNDDRIISAEVRDMMRHSDKAYCIRGEYSHEVYRAFFERYADLVVASRMHAAIAAASVGVPVVLLGYSRKAQGIFGRMLGLQDLIVDIRECDTGDVLAVRLKKVINDCWQRRAELRAHLLEKSALLRKQTEVYVSLLRDIVDSRVSLKVSRE